MSEKLSLAGAETAEDHQLEDQLLDLLKDSGRYEAKTLDQAYLAARRDHIRFDRAVLRLGIVEEDHLLDAIAAVTSVPRYTASSHSVDAASGRILTTEYLTARRAVPLQISDDRRLVAMADPLDGQLVQEMSFHLSETVTPVAATTAEIRALLNDITLVDGEADDAVSDLQALDHLSQIDADGPVIRFVQEILSNAVQAGASDLHVEAADETLTLRFRINGLLVPQRVDRSLSAQSIVARLKVMANLNVAERRLPQDGRLEAMIAGRRVDFRFSSLPTHNGESVVARVLDPKALRLGWDRLGFDPDTVAWIEDILNKPSGLFLVTGPTGSGKTTTLYTALSILNSSDRKIITVEDPVEYSLSGMQQIQVQDEIGLTFARVLRGVLRHDPNVIMIGEIRDAETAEIAVRAAQVGRLVLSTLHTNSAAGAVNRLIDLGVAPFLLDDVLRGVLGQKLVVKQCPNCHAQGCSDCNGTGVGQRFLDVERWPNT